MIGVPDIVRIGGRRNIDTQFFSLVDEEYMEEALKMGNSRVFNIIVLGVAAKHMDFSKEAWLDVIEKTVPPKTVEINKKAFLLGFVS